MKPDQHDKLKAFLDRNDEAPPQAPSGEWNTLRTLALAGPRSRAPLWRFALFPAGVAAMAMLAVITLRSSPMPPATSKEDAVEIMLAAEGYFEDDAEIAGSDYLALLE